MRVILCSLRACVCRRKVISRILVDFGKLQSTSIRNYHALQHKWSVNVSYDNVAVAIETPDNKHQQAISVYQRLVFLKLQAFRSSIYFRLLLYFTWTIEFLFLVFPFIYFDGHRLRKSNELSVKWYVRQHDGRPEWRWRRRQKSETRLYIEQIARFRNVLS